MAGRTRRPTHPGDAKHCRRGLFAPTRAPVPSREARPDGPAPGRVVSVIRQGPPLGFSARLTRPPPRRTPPRPSRTDSSTSLLVQLIRRSGLEPSDTSASWLQELGVPAVGATLHAIQPHPARAWTIDALGGGLGVPRHSGPPIPGSGRRHLPPPIQLRMCTLPALSRTGSLAPASTSPRTRSPKKILIHGSQPVLEGGARLSRRATVPDPTRRSDSTRKNQRDH